MKRKSQIFITVLMTFFVTVCCLVLALYCFVSYFGSDLFLKRKTSNLFTHESAYAMHSNQRIVNVLVIAGGGSMGIIPLTILDYIDKNAKQPLAKSIDMYVGTSTGAIISAGLDYKGAGKTAAHSQRVSQILHLYVTLPGKVFKQSFWRNITSCYGLCGARYSHKPLALAMHQFLGDSLMMQMNKPLMFPSFDLTSSDLIEFNSWDKKADFATTPVYKLLLGATSAPVEFTPYVIKFNGHNKIHMLVDGGIVANTPSVMAYFAARKRFPNSDIRLIVIGDGNYNDVLTPKLSRINSMGLLAWSHIVVKMFLHGHALLANQYLSALVHQPGSHLVEYYRLNFSVPPDELHPFDGSPQYIQYLQHRTQQFIRADKKQLDSLIQHL